MKFADSNSVIAVQFIIRIMLIYDTRVQFYRARPFFQILKKA